MRKQYEVPVAELILFPAEDVIRTSSLELPVIPIGSVDMDIGF